MSAIKVLSTLAVMGAMRDLARQFEAAGGESVDADFSPTVALLERLRGGETADVAILIAQGVEDLIREGIIHAGSRAGVALSFVGIAAKAGAPKPDIGTVDALKASLLAASCVAYSRIGASGLYFAELLKRLGIAEQVNSRALIVPSGLTAERLVSGEADLAVQQISELMVVPGIEVVGPLPSAVQTVATFSGGLLTDRPEAAALLRFLASPLAAPALRASGLEPSPATC
ncbi:MAG: substrate-binding domain-containing protein [Rhodopila sp.]